MPRIPIARNLARNSIRCSTLQLQDLPSDQQHPRHPCPHGLRSSLPCPPGCSVRRRPHGKRPTCPPAAGCPVFPGPVPPCTASTQGPMKPASHRPQHVSQTQATCRGPTMKMGIVPREAHRAAPAGQPPRHVLPTLAAQPIPGQPPSFQPAPGSPASCHRHPALVPAPWARRRIGQPKPGIVLHAQNRSPGCQWQRTSHSVRRAVPAPTLNVTPPTPLTHTARILSPRARARTLAGTLRSCSGIKASGCTLMIQ